MWHTPWGANAPDFPHEFVIKLPRRESLTGVVLLPRQDGNPNGWIKDVEILLSDDGQSWSDPVVKTTLQRNAKPKRLWFQHAGTDQGLSTQYVKVRALSGFDDQVFASLADFGVMRAE